ncbi:MAG: pyridoxine 5'-phosphate synthase [Candidatus Brocadia sp. AMX2]|uniref:Pyridoxine 5'-phosphate synthase n=1 Tax=Candidatus Brocadia sinica JPN1 TaxID=1197129 RepID=A0ABQ0JYL7_9BACT|nr:MULTISPECIES: pyridoxine 5'-phosphate synthase [Brocadia]MBC6932340.1 pyridoxine 5'-phosphate synthase [Candidatus Brocadia sp.]MBL1169844.1 pyridoxine 5'-phosphate synthase [Candidatus Brocadia sp. AMX1]MCK6469348.1 pyridoxine 5'-phosphate synthase [Candidatus Brocadia sinica]NOG40289.1 pyridoxine 5'-phosphate synthase [Planctomycetota bacterium]KAA0243759.1 MAG: pyridoxine 5'-phosphate synthase [Candidatus Brocadia sp. AMX2]
MIKLGVNIDHVATIRQARKTFEPDPVTAASLAILGGADIITVHLREDRRHIQDRDVRLLRGTVFTKLNLEMSIAREIVDIAIETKPEQVTLVPEKRQEVTTEGGLDVVSHKKVLVDIVKRFRDAGICVSFFIDPEEDQISASKDVGAQYIELHTGNYAHARDDISKSKTIGKLQSGMEVAQKLGLRVNAGHGLTYQNVGLLVESMDVEELHIGHSIVSRAVFVGIQKAVSEMKELIFRHELARKALDQ